jgi:hypothetical protein
MAKNTTMSHKILFTGFLLSNIIKALPTAITDKRINKSVTIFISPFQLPQQISVTENTGGRLKMIN